MVDRTPARSCGLASRADAAGFDHGAIDGEAIALGGVGEIDQRVARVELFGGAAFLADEKDGGARTRADIAGNEGVEALDAMREAETGEEIERAINSWWFGHAFVAAEERQQVISLRR